MLAISLHAVRDELRDQLVPINKKWPIKELLAACRAYPGLSNAKRITFEYVMLKGVNDSVADAKELVRLLAKIPAKINLIPFNPWPGAPFECSDWEQIEKFAEVVNRAGYASPVRSPARPRHHGGLRAAEERQHQAARQRPTTRCHSRESGNPVTIEPVIVRTVFRMTWVVTALLVATRSRLPCCLRSAPCGWVTSSRKRRRTTPCCNRERRCSARCCSPAP